MNKVALVTTCWLGNQEYIDKTLKWLNYYSGIQNHLKYDDIILIDNASPSAKIKLIEDQFPNVNFIHFDNHLTRTSHLEYPYLWRAVHTFQELLATYEKIIYMDNDFYVLSKSMTEYINDIGPIWWSPWCSKHQFPETGLQVLTKGVQDYWDFVSKPYMSYNGLCMETTLPVITNEICKGDRHSEYGITEQQPGWDFTAQAPLNMEIKFNVNR